MDREAIEDLFAGLGAVRTRRMFGGQGIYLGDLIFGIQVGGELFLKADADTVERFRANRSRPFAFEQASGRVITTSYWSLPEAAFDDPEEATAWGRLALEAARRAAAAKASRRRR